MIYLDNSATSPIAQEVFEAMRPYLQEEYGNPSSKYYLLAAHAADAVENSREWVAKLIHAKPEEIIFTCGSTESSNMIIKGVADYKKYYEKKGNHIITSKVEHHATLNTCRFLNGDIYSNQDATFSLFGKVPKVDRGYEVTFLDVNKYGQVTPESFEKAIRPTTTLASFIWANNEIGSLNDMDALVTVAHKHHVLLHADATQIAGKLPINVDQTKVDFLSLSAHKFHGPKGVGAAYIRGDDYGLPPMSAFMHGGEQEHGLRAGTLARFTTLLALEKLPRLAIANEQRQIACIQKLEQTAKKIIASNEHLELLGDSEHHLPGVISLIVNLDDFDNERFVKRISAKFAVSTGSACTAGMPSHVLQAIGKGDAVSRVLRISLSAENTIDQVEAFLKELS
ncbi:MAG: cysteine desulfurase family protein [Dysosmobacter sp.]